MDIHNSFLDIHKSIYGYPIFNLFMDIKNDLYISQNDLWLSKNDLWISKNDLWISKIYLWISINKEYILKGHPIKVKVTIISQWSLLFIKF